MYFDLYNDIHQLYKIAYYDLMREAQEIEDEGHNFKIKFRSEQSFDLREGKSGHWEYFENYKIFFTFETDAPDEWSEIMFHSVIDKFQAIKKSQIPYASIWYGPIYTPPTPPKNWSDLNGKELRLQIWDGETNYDESGEEDLKWRKEEFEKLPPVTKIE